MELANEEWLKSVLRSIVCQVTPFALKINAILAFGTHATLKLRRSFGLRYLTRVDPGALISGQRHWADIFFDKWRRLLTEFFDSSDYEVAEGTPPPPLPTVQASQALALSDDQLTHLPHSEQASL